MKLHWHRRTLVLRDTLHAAWGELRERTILEVELVGSDGVVGRGECAPLEPYDGVPLGACEAALDEYGRIMHSGGDAPGGELLEACRKAIDLPQALAAIDLALWDRAGRRARKPVAALLADRLLDAIPVNATVGAQDRDRAAEAAEAASAAGFRCVKIKVGIGDDEGRVSAVREAAGERMALRLDANGAWSVGEAVRSIELLSESGLEIVEEPVSGVAAMRAVRERVPVRIALDETTSEPGALAAGVADAVCLKISRSGGISGLLAQAALVRAGGAEVYLASTFDGPLGVAAALHCAAALRVELPCGLATLDMFDEPTSLPVHDGMLELPEAFGLL